METLCSTFHMDKNRFIYQHIKEVMDMQSSQGNNFCYGFPKRGLIVGPGKCGICNFSTFYNQMRTEIYNNHRKSEHLETNILSNSIKIEEKKS